MADPPVQEMMKRALPRELTAADAGDGMEADPINGVRMLPAPAVSLFEPLVYVFVRAEVGLALACAVDSPMRRHPCERQQHDGAEQSGKPHFASRDIVAQ